MALPLALQLYSLREDGAKDFPLVLRKVAAMGYKGVEYAGLHDMAPAEVARIVADLGMESVSAHMAAPTAETIGQTLEQAKALGISFIVGGGGRANYESVDTIKALAETLEAGAELLEPHGIRLGIHNHWCEFDHQVDGRCPHDILMSLTSKLFAQVDVCWAELGGDDPVAVIRRNTGRVDLVHVKDSSLARKPDGTPATAHTAVGGGNVDIPGCVAAASECGTTWLIVELDNCATSMEEAVRQSAAYMISNGLAEGTGGR